MTKRERRSWIWVLVVVAAIWSTLGLAGTLVEALKDRRWLDAAFFVSFVVTIGVIVAGALKRRPSGREIWVVLGIATVYVMVVVRMGVPPEERTHLFEYGLVAVLVHRALSERLRGIRAAALAVVITALLGWIDEGIQALLPNRVYDLRDVGFNALAGLMAIGASLVLARVSGRGRHSGTDFV